MREDPEGGPAIPAIRTPDQRLRVFVSSTLTELADERAAVARAVTALRLTPVLFELGARPHPPQDVYRAYLAQSDIFVGLYWQRYGWVGPGMDISGLEDEFELSLAMPRLLYVKTPAPEREPRLTAMIERIQSDAAESYRSFRDPRELGRLVRDDLAVLLSERFTAAAPAPPPAAGSRPAGPSRHSLPTVSTALIGRDQDIAEVSELLERPEVRLVTVTGPGGVGKTRLAVAVAERMEDRYDRGAVFVPLAPIHQPELVLPRIAAALGIPQEGNRPPLEALVEQLADTRTLLLLDNVEQVVGVGPDLDQLLARCPGLEILATSRTALRLRAEHEYPVEPLASSPAVELFVDRARAVRPDFALTEDNQAAVTEICRRLDGLPLAIELAAARIRLLEPDALLVRLGHRLDALGSGPVDLPERQRTLRATVEWSIGLLDDAERDMLADLSVFVDGWTVEAATSVTDLGEPRTLDLLDALTGQSLVHVATTETGTRFRMLEAVREFAAELLAASPDRAAVVERRHAHYFRELAEQADAAYEEAQSGVVDRLQAEEGNVRRAVGWFLAHDVGPVPHILRNLWRFWQARERMPDARAWIDELLPRAAGFDDRTRTELQLASAVTAIESGDDERAVAAAEELRRLQERIDDLYLRSSAQLVRSWILPIVDDLDGAVREASAAVDGFRHVGKQFMISAAIGTLGGLELAKGQHEAARRHLTETEARGRQSGSDWYTSVSRTQLAWLAAEEGQIDEAQTRLRGLLDLDAEPGLSTHVVTLGLATGAQLALADGDPCRAARALGAADELRRRAGVRLWPSMRRREDELRARVAQELDPQDFEEAFTSGSQLTRREAVALVRPGN